MGDRLNEAVESHLLVNGDWNINDWRDVASALAARVRELEEALAYVVGWIRYGEGNESRAAELADAALADAGEEQE